MRQLVQEGTRKVEDVRRSDTIRQLRYKQRPDIFGVHQNSWTPEARSFVCRRSSAKTRNVQKGELQTLTQQIQTYSPRSSWVQTDNP